MGIKERFLPLATVRKTFGKGGELIVKFRPGVSQSIIDQLGTKEPVFIQVDGIPVPFYFTSVTLRGNDQAMVCFENYLSENLAAEWVGKTLLYKAGESAAPAGGAPMVGYTSVSYTHLRAHETVLDLVCRLLLEKKKKHTQDSRRQYRHTTKNTTSGIQSGY